MALLSDSGTSSSTLDWDTTGLAVPKSLLPSLPSSAAPASLAVLTSRGELAPLVVKSEAIQYMMVTSAVGRDSGNLPLPRSEKQIFSVRDKQAAAYVNWQSSRKEKVSYSLRLFNVDNKLLASSKAREISLSPGRYASTTWNLPVGMLSPGIYRVDLLVNDTTSWREFIRIIE
jgi:hypothetical protein